MWANKASSTAAAVALPRCGWITTSVSTKPGQGSLLDILNISDESFSIVKILRNLLFIILLIPLLAEPCCWMTYPPKKPKFPHGAQRALAKLTAHLGREQPVPSRNTVQIWVALSNSTPVFPYPPFHVAVCPDIHLCAVSCEAMGCQAPLCLLDRKPHLCSATYCTKPPPLEE